MDVELIIKSIMGLIALLALLIFLFFYNPLKREQKPLQISKEEEREDEESNLEVLLSILKNNNSEATKLAYVLKMILKYHGKIHKNVGTRSHTGFALYSTIFFFLCRHPNTNKNLILTFEKELAALNPDYKREINDALMRSLNTRGT